MTRVAVVGVPRSGTSAFAGVCRILGHQLPGGYDPQCVISESIGLRGTSNGGRPISDIVTDVNQLMDGIVWKDPSVGIYADKVTWNRWRIIWVDRLMSETQESEKRWTRQDVNVLSRNTKWIHAIDDALISQQISEEEVYHARLSDLRADPVGNAESLSRFLTGKNMSRKQQERVSAFITPDHEYRCPMPSECALEHSHPMSLVPAAQ